MSNFLEICQSLGQINLENIKDQKRGRMAVVVTKNAQLDKQNLSKNQQYYMTFPIIDPSKRLDTKCFLFTKDFIAFSKGDILIGKFYVYISFN